MKMETGIRVKGKEVAGREYLCSGAAQEEYEKEGVE